MDLTNSLSFNHLHQLSTNMSLNHLSVEEKEAGKKDTEKEKKTEVREVNTCRGGRFLSTLSIQYFYILSILMILGYEGWKHHCFYMETDDDLQSK